MQKRLLYIFLILDLLIINSAISFFVYDRFFAEKSTSISEVTTQKANVVATSGDSSCSEECVSLIQEEIAKIEPQVVEKTVEKEVLVSQPVLQSTLTGTKRVSYITIPNSGSSLSNTWASLTTTGFYLDKSDYPGLQSISFEASMRLGNGNGKAYLRIYDLTHNIAVNGSEVSTSSQDSVIVSSSDMNLWEGNNQYVVQARSLTADTAYFEWGRLKVVQEY